MHSVFERYLKYILWFIFAVVLGAFLVGFAKFGFNVNLYIDYLNGVEVKQLFQANPETDSASLETGSDVLPISGTQDIYDPSLDADFFGTGTQESGAFSTGSTDETFGFVKNSENTGKLEETTKTEAKATIVSTGSAATGDKLKAILDLAKKEK